MKPGDFFVVFLSFWLLLNFVIFLWVLYARLEQIEITLSKCSFIHINRRIWRSDPIGRLYRLNFINLVLLAPNFFHRRGDIDIDQVLSFPRSQLYFIRTIYLSKFMSVLALGIWYVVETY